MNVDDLYEVEPETVEDLYDVDGSPIEQEYEVSPPLEEEYELPEPPDPAENFREVMGQVGQVGTMVGKIAIPVAAGAAATLAFPPAATYLGTAGMGAASGVVGGLATTAASNLLEGEPVTKDISLGSMGRDAVLGGASSAGMRAVAPYVMRGAAATGRGIARATRGLRNRLPQRTPPVSTLPGYDRAMALDAPLPDVEPMPMLMHDQPDMTVARDDLEMGLLDNARSELSSAEFVLRRSPRSQAANIAAERLRGMNRDTHSERALAHRNRLLTGVAELDENERRAVTVALAGRFDELPPQYQTQRVLEATQRARGGFYDPASEKLAANRAATIATAGPNRGEVVPYHPRPDYVPWIPNERAGRGAARLRELLANRTRTTQTMFQRTGERGPDTQALEELWGIEGPQPTNWVTDADEAMRVYIEGGRGRVGYPELVARSRHFGPIQAQHPDAEHPWGEDANVLYQQMLEARDPLDAELFKNAMEPVYRPGRPSGGDRAARWLKDQTSHVMLGQTATTQLTQGATPVWRFGIGNDLRGKYDYVVDDSYRDLANVSGAQDAAWARELGDPMSAGNRATQGVEEGLRGFGNAGVKPYLQELIERVQNGNVDAATRFRLRELGLDPADVQGGMDAHTLKQAFEESAHKNQFHPYDPGESGAAFLTDKGRALTMYQPFGHAAWRNFQEGVLEPALGPQGWRQAYQTGDYSLQRMGAARAGRMLLAGVPAAVATETAKSVGGLREFDPTRVVTGFLDSNIGTPSMLATSFASGYRPENNLIPPWLSLLGQQANNLQTGHPERSLIDAAAIADRSGWVSVLRPALMGLTKDER